MSMAAKVKNEIREMIPTAIYFVLTFNLIALTQTLILAQYGVQVSSFVTATALALVVAKVVLIADHLPFIDRFPHKPLVYNVVWKTSIYFVFSGLLRYLEHFIRFWRKTGSFAGSHQHLVDELVWPRFWAIQLWMLLLLSIFCAIREFTRAIGRAEMIDIFFLRSVASHAAKQPQR